MGDSIDLRKAGEPIDVNVVNQLDLSTIEALLTQIRDSTAAIDANTDLVETKLDSVISELQTNGTTNHTDLLNVITELQSIDANTDGLETQLASIISNTSTNATEATLLGLLNAFTAEDFATETTLAALNAVIQMFTFTGGDLNVNASVTLPAGLATEATLALIEAQTAKLNFIGTALEVSASVTPPAGVKRSIDVIESLANGSTVDDVQSMSIWFDGKNGTLDGVSVPDGYVASFSPNGGSDTVGSIAYTVPDTKGLRVVITYVNKT